MVSLPFVTTEDADAAERWLRRQMNLAVTSTDSPQVSKILGLIGILTVESLAYNERGAFVLAGNIHADGCIARLSRMD